MTVKKDASSIYVYVVSSGNIWNATCWLEFSHLMLILIKIQSYSTQISQVMRARTQNMFRLPSNLSPLQALGLYHDHAV